MQKEKKNQVGKNRLHHTSKSFLIKFFLITITLITSISFIALFSSSTFKSSFAYEPVAYAEIPPPNLKKGNINENISEITFYADIDLEKEEIKYITNKTINSSLINPFCNYKQSESHLTEIVCKLNFEKKIWKNVAQFISPITYVYIPENKILDYKIVINKSKEYEIKRKQIDFRTDVKLEKDKIIEIRFSELYQYQIEIPKFPIFELFVYLIMLIVVFGTINKKIIR